MKTGLKSLSNMPEMQPYACQVGAPLVDHFDEAQYRTSVCVYSN
jgi:hypothetical protein